MEYLIQYIRDGMQEINWCQCMPNLLHFKINALHDNVNSSKIKKVWALCKFLFGIVYV